MCGIAGIANVFPAAPPRRSELVPMIQQVQHRGPDGYGYFTDDRVGLAHARLSIIDLAGGDQPIHNEDETVWVVFNGEIFNYVELRRQLEGQGHRFYTHSDTEVIVHLYEQHGDDFVDHLNGQFAIALWDTVRKRLVLARDRVGIRPLFFTEAGHRLLFSSEIKSLLAHDSVTRQLNVPALGQIFTYWAPLPGTTLFKGISALPPGHIMSVADGRVEMKRYWDWQFPDANAPTREANLGEYREEVLALLIDSVRLQLRADVPVGAYLSGGLDSSIVTTIIKNYTDTPLRTFSVGFEDAEFDEARYQQELVKYLGTDHTALHTTTRDIGAAFARTIWHTETTILRTAPTPLMLLSGRVRQEGYKVVLTGEGADEVFGGYDIFKEAKIRRFWARNPNSRMRPLIFDRLYPYLKNSPTQARAFSQQFFKQGLDHVNRPYFAHIPRWSTTQRTWQFFHPDIKRALAGFDPYRAIEETLPPDIGRWRPLNRDQYVEAETLMSGYLLCSQGDRVALANSVEGRFPFLDHRLIEFANRLPPRYKIMGLTEKFLLKSAMQGLLPEAIRTRTKQPYRAPDSASFFVDGKPLDYVEDLLSADRIRAAGYFDPVATGKLFEKCRQGKAIGFGDNMAFVGLLSTMLVDELFIRAARVPQTFAETSFARIAQAI